MDMRWSAFSLVVLVVLNAALLQAQSTIGGSVHSGPLMPGSHAVGGQGTGTRPPSFSSRVHFGENLRHRELEGGAVWLPWYYPDWGFGEYLWNLPDSYQQPVVTTPPQVMVVENKDSRAAVAPVEPSKLIEVPQSKEAPESKEVLTVKRQPSTMFVLKSGERLESRYYLLTSQSLQLQVGREQRTIPVSSLDIDSTIAVNRQRGIELTVPRDANTVFLSF